MKFKIVLAATTILVALAGNAFATVIGFEDFPTGVEGAYPAPGYSGFDWSGGFGANSWVVSPNDAAYFPGPQSFAGNFYAWSNGGSSLDLKKHGGGAFDFSNFEGKFYTPSGATGVVIATGYLNGIQTYSKTIDLTDQYTLVSLNFNGVDDVTLSTFPYYNLILDNLTVSTGGVPEPTSWALMLIGVGGLGAALRSSRRRSPVKAT